MLRVDVGIEKADRDGGHARSREQTPGLDHLGRVERHENGAVCGDPLAHLQPPAARHQRLRLAPGEVEHTGRANAADLQHVAKAGCGDQAAARAGLLQQRV